MSRHTEISLDRTKRELVRLLGNWDGASLVQIGDYRDQSDEREAIVVFEFNGNRVRVAYNGACCHRCNMRAIFITLEDLRKAYNKGLGDLMAHTVSQMLALPGAEYIDPYELLGVRPDAPMEAIEAMWKYQLKQWHPDRHPENVEEATRRTTQLNAAIERIRADKEAAA